MQAKNIIVATGATAAVPGAWKVDGKKVVTYLEATSRTLPKSVVIIGSGAIGVEFATVWSSYGVDVTIVEMLPRLVPLEDEEVSKELKKEFEKRGIKCLVGNKVEFGRGHRHRRCSQDFVRGQADLLEADQALVAIGFRPHTKGFGLEEVGVKLTERGFIEINDKMQTSVPNIWAIGDVTGKLMLAHVGSAMGISARRTLPAPRPSPSTMR